jgi:hypothetical protein
MAVRFILIYYIDYFFTPPRLRLKQAVSPRTVWDIQIRMDVRVWVNITLFVKPATELLREMMFMRGLDIGGLSRWDQR